MDGGEEGKEGGSEAGRRKCGREGRRKGRREETRQGGGRKRGSPPRHSINRAASARPCLTREGYTSDLGTTIVSMS